MLQTIVQPTEFDEPSKAAFRVAAALVAVLCLVLAGCSQPHAEGPAEAPPAVTVSYPVEREVIDQAEFTARIEAVDSVEVKARVSGYLVKIPFKEGAEVKKDDILFEIDPRPYQARLDINLALLQHAEAKANQARTDYGRYERLVQRSAATQQEYDDALANRDFTLADVAAANANITSSKLDLEFCTVRSPINGRVSKYGKTVGNLVTQDQTLLTTVVSTDPMYVYFAVDEPTVLKVKNLITAGKLKSIEEAEVPVSLALENEQGFPHQGTINFTDNQLKASTATLLVRGVFPNPDRILTPGMFARVRVPVSARHAALLITERALDTDQGQKVVYVVDKDNKVVSRPVRLGAMHDGLREITDGLKPGERIIVNGLQLVRPGVTVESKLVDMPTKKG